MSLKQSQTKRRTSWPPGVLLKQAQNLLLIYMAYSDKLPLETEETRLSLLIIVQEVSHIEDFPISDEQYDGYIAKVIALHRSFIKQLKNK